MNKSLNTIFCLFGTLILANGCGNKQFKLQKEIVGTWHLTTQGQNIFDKGVIIYSSDGQMSVILSKTDSVVTGYSGKYEVNEQASFVKHFRDYYTLLPFINDSTPPVWIRDVKLSADKQTLTLSPREDRSFSLVWKKVHK